MNAAIQEPLSEKHGHLKFPVLVIYNGIDKKINVSLNDTVKALLDLAIHAFGPLQNPHLLGLFTRDGQELKDGQTITEAGVKPGDDLLMRPSAVRGG